MNIDFSIDKYYFVFLHKPHFLANPSDGKIGKVIPGIAKHLSIKHFCALRLFRSENCLVCLKCQAQTQ